ncbi:MAG: response regulator [Oscillospiraceae bacterium]
MYRILLVDDEPIILSGIKFLIDWASFGCEIMGTARNGRQALDFISAHSPDIVICDITMPVCTGLEVLKEVAETPEPPVFIMLSNHSDFSMAQEALRLQAVDYLLKTQLEEATLEKSLLLAIEKCEERHKLARVHQADNYMQENRSMVTAEHMKNLLFVKNDVFPKESLTVLQAEGALESYFIVQIMIDYSDGGISIDGDEENRRLYEWENELVEKLAGNVFKSFTIFDPDLWRRSLVLYVWNFEGDKLNGAVTQFFTKLETATANITQMKLSMLVSNLYSGEESLSVAAKDMISMREYYMNSGAKQIFADKVPQLEFTPINMQDICNKMMVAIRVKNAAECGALFDKAEAQISDGAHLWRVCINACVELYSLVAMALTPLLQADAVVGYLQDSSAMVRVIRHFSTRHEALVWLRELKRQTLGHMEQLTSARGSIAENAKQYILANADKRIMLQDVADYVNISASYLSALFKKTYDQSLVDFINQTKVRRACELIQDGKYRIYEISYMLSFENAYYFTKVFKKHTGLTPTEYQRNKQGAQSNDK